MEEWFVCISKNSRVFLKLMVQNVKQNPEMTHNCATVCVVCACFLRRKCVRLSASLKLGGRRALNDDQIASLLSPVRRLTLLCVVKELNLLHKSLGMKYRGNFSSIFSSNSEMN